MQLNIVQNGELVLTAEFDNPLDGPVTVAYVNPFFQATVSQWLSEEQFVLSHDEETGGYAGRTSGLDDIRAFEQKVISLVHEMGEGWDYEVIDDSATVTKGGAGSGSWEGPGQPRFAWSSTTNRDAATVAQQYTRSKGLPEYTSHEPVVVDRAQAKRIAEAYEKMENNPSSPEVQAAYKALGDEVEAQFKLLPVKIEFTSGDPYPNSAEMMRDVRENNRLRVFTGGDAHPLLGAKDETGISQNDKFRAVHDYFGHYMGGFQFGPSGEENAWVEHSKMFTPLAQRAMTTETRGQNSWFNFSTENEGKPVGERKFAEQKVGILPEEFLPSATTKRHNTIHELDESNNFCPLHPHLPKIAKGGEGSGNFGHAGRPGEVGGSGAGSGEKPDISRETADTPTPSYLKTLDDVKQYLGQGTKMILSAERAHLSAAENLRRSIGLKRILQNYDENVISQQGQWGGVSERSYVVSVGPEAVADLESLAFATNELDQDAIIVIKDGVAELRYRDGKTQRGLVTGMKDTREAKDNYSRIGDVQYRMDFDDE